MILDFLFFLILILISILDFKYKKIPDTLLLLIFILSIFKNGNILTMYRSMALLSFPLFLILLLELHIEKELIGLGDIKLIIALSCYLENIELSGIYIYYLISYSLAIIYIVYLKYIDKLENYIAFGPMLIYSYIICYLMLW